MMIDGYVAEILNNQIMNEINTKKATDKEKLIEKDIKSVKNRIRHAFNQGYEAGLKHGKEQEPKTGHWIRWYEKISYENSTEYNPHCKCSECNTEYDPHTSQFIKYCNVCGAKMESEGKNE